MNKYYAMYDFDTEEYGISDKIQPICLPTPDTVIQFARMGQFDGQAVNGTSSSSGVVVPSWAIAIILAALSLVTLAVIVLGIYVKKTRRMKKQQQQSEETMIEKGASLLDNDNPVAEMINDLKEEF